MGRYERNYWYRQEALSIGRDCGRGDEEGRGGEGAMSDFGSRPRTPPGVSADAEVPTVAILRQIGEESVIRAES